MTIVEMSAHESSSTAMSTEPPSARGSASAASTRLAAKLAWREVTRRRARTALVVLLIAVPSAAMVFAAAMYRTDGASSAASGRRPGADVIANSYLGSPANPLETDEAIAALDLPDGSQVVSYLFAQVPVTPSGGTLADGREFGGTVSNMPLDTRLTRDLVDLGSGRAPVGPDEVLLSPEIADRLDLSVGDQMVLERPSGSWTVTGIGRFAPSYWQELILFGEFDTSRVSEGFASYETLIDLPAGTSDTEIARIAVSADGYMPDASEFLYNSDDPATGDVALGWLIGAMAFLVFGIVVAAAFATSARSQLVTVGHLAANGAPQRLINRVLSWQGMWSGVLGGALGAVIALASLPFLHETAQVHFFRASTEWAVRPLDVVIVIATATIAGLLAALVPSRALARTSVLSALAGRRPVKAVPTWLLPVGGILFAGGTGLMALAVVAGRSSVVTTTYTIAAVLGGAGVALGVVCISPWIVQQAARLARWMPLSGRLSLRSLSRSRGRTAAVISAIAVTVALATVTVSGVEQMVSDERAGDRYLPLDTLVLAGSTDRIAEAFGTFDYWTETERYDERTGEFTFIEVDIDLPSLTDVELAADALAAVAVMLPEATMTPLRSAATPGGPVTWSGDGFGVDVQVAIASPATFRAGGWSASAQRQFAETGYARLVAPAGSYQYPSFDEDPSLVGDRDQFPLGSPALIEDPSAPENTKFSELISEEYARSIGLDIVTTGAIVVNPEPFAADQREEFRWLWSSFNPGYRGVDSLAFIEPGDPVGGAEVIGDDEVFTFVETSYQWVDESVDRALLLTRLIALGAAVLLIGVVVAIGLSLAASDNRDERSVLAVVGARPQSLRRMAATNAVTMTLLGIVIGVPAGFVPGWVVARSASYTNASIPFPWLFVGALVVIVPALMMLTAWAGSVIASRFATPNLHQTT